METIAQLHQQLRDIRGLDPWAWWQWPLGWWVLLAGGALLWWWLQGYKNRPSPWQREGKRQLLQLRQQIKRAGVAQNDSEFIQQFSQLMRRIAIARFGRKTCAGLSGLPWLQWLTQHDPRGFDWQKYPDILLKYNYLPKKNLNTVDVKHPLQQLINAALAWLK